MSTWTDVQSKGQNFSSLDVVKGLWEHFADSRIVIEALTGYSPNGGKGCPPMKVTLFFEGGRLKVAVNDPTGKRVGFASVAEGGPRSLGAAIAETLEGGLDWRPTRDQGGMQRR